jgi:hypothetical protein
MKNRLFKIINEIAWKTYSAKLKVKRFLLLSAIVGVGLAVQFQAAFWGK